MPLSRRSFFGYGSAVLGALHFGKLDLPSQERRRELFSNLKSMTTGVKPLAVSDFETRIEQARKLMIEHKTELFFLTAGSSMEYFGGVRWGHSERVFAMLIPAQGEIAYVCPKFEEGRAREQIRVRSDIRTWEEDQSPYVLLREVLKDLKILSGTVGIEPNVRQFVLDGLKKACPGTTFVNGENISQGCRMIKNQKEVQYIALACEITKKAYQAALLTLREGMSQSELARAISIAHSRLGAPGGAAVSFGPNTAFPHGSTAERLLKPGDVILMDGGCRVEGFHSDITRTVVLGKPTDKLQRIWDIVRKAQDAALAAAHPGVPCETVDAAARKVIVAAGFGPDYKYFTHRLGHGIGLDGHEYPYLVRGNKLPLRPGMTFSNEPGIYIGGEFGVRLEDLIYIAEDGAQFFGNTSPSLVSY